MLWFAFNSVYLNYQKQHSLFARQNSVSCDLLSIQYIWTTRNNKRPYRDCIFPVVICFQFSIFELPETTHRLRYRLERCCDLLSIQYIWTTRNNCCRSVCTCHVVVICFQFSIFELPETTSILMQLFISLLWFAFNSVYLNYQKQPNPAITDPLYVVICFQFSIFELPETTL